MTSQRKPVRVRLISPKTWCVLISLAILFTSYLAFLTYNQEQDEQFEFTGSEHEYKNCPLNAQVLKLLQKLIKKDGGLWGEDWHVSKKMQVLEFGVWQGQSFQQLVERINVEQQYKLEYNGLFYGDVADAWCPCGNGELKFDTFVPEEFQPADFVVSVNGLSSVSNVTRYLQHILKLRKPNGTAIIVDDPYFFSFRGHRVFGKWFQLLTTNLECKNMVKYYQQETVMKDYIQLTHSEAEVKKEMDKFFLGCSQGATKVKEFIKNQVITRVPVEQLQADIYNLGKVSVRALRLFHNDTTDTSRDGDWKDKYQNLIEQRWQHAKYFGDAIVLIIKDKL